MFIKESLGSARKRRSEWDVNRNVCEQERTCQNKARKRIKGLKKRDKKRTNCTENRLLSITVYLLVERRQAERSWESGRQ